jgi:hypothetical protein
VKTNSATGALRLVWTGCSWRQSPKRCSHDSAAHSNNSSMHGKKKIYDFMTTMHVNVCLLLSM